MKDEYYIFTFGCGQPHAGYYVKIKGRFYEARQKMLNKYGRKWSMQYSEKDWNYMLNDPNRTHPMEELLEIIE